MQDRVFREDDQSGIFMSNCSVSPERIYSGDIFLEHPLAEVLMHSKEGLSDFTKFEKVLDSI